MKVLTALRGITQCGETTFMLNNGHFPPFLMCHPDLSSWTRVSMEEYIVVWCGEILRPNEEWGGSSQCLILLIHVRRRSPYSHGMAWHGMSLSGNQQRHFEVSVDHFPMSIPPAFHFLSSASSSSSTTTERRRRLTDSMLERQPIEPKVSNDNNDDDDGDAGGARQWPPADNGTGLSNALEREEREMGVAIVLSSHTHTHKYVTICI